MPKLQVLQILFERRIVYGLPLALLNLFAEIEAMTALLSTT